MTVDRVSKLKELLTKNPRDAMTRYMLANELFKTGEYGEAAEQLESYLRDKEDEGAAYRVLSEAYLKLGRRKEAIWALRQGAEAARAHHHDGMADEFEERLREL